MSGGRRWIAAGLLAASTVALTGCSGTANSGSGSAASAGSTTSSTTSSAPSGSTTGNPSDNGAAAAGVTAGDKPVVTTQVPFVDSRNAGSVTVGVLPLKRRGKLMILRVVFTPTVTSGTTDPVLLYDVLSSDGFTPTLIDNPNLKRYRVIPAGRTLRSDEAGTKTTNGQPMYAWAVFAAPRDDIHSIDVQVSDGIPRFLNVPIE